MSIPSHKIADNQPANTWKNEFEEGDYINRNSKNFSQFCKGFIGSSIPMMMIESLGKRMLSRLIVAYENLNRLLIF